MFLFLLLLLCVYRARVLLMFVAWSMSRAGANGPIFFPWPCGAPRFALAGRPLFFLLRKKKATLHPRLPPAPHGDSSTRAHRVAAVTKKKRKMIQCRKKKRSSRACVAESDDRAEKKARLSCIPYALAH